ncbi:hypothetical protein A8C56_21030 [Niabella ginsenosidivorans]|uniref:MalT-like TPR region domain-containing protein n=1 Tax=Niabella ginsenosidivorans TaxID=1176587 RepID=A0A1A9I6D4_9BACT|nr:hypothetical protein [Niabella ginsenosidivorans]ANH83133.1 hypothetical protein A8C56_21030 [Niabella ginsenosidivorans]
MNRIRHLFLLTSVFFFFFCRSLCAQYMLGDTLLRQLQQPGLPISQQAQVMAQLAALYVKSDSQKGRDYGRRALELARRSGDAAVQSYVFSYLSNVYFSTESDTATAQAVDSALWYAGQTKNRMVRGLAWYRKGWLQNIENRPEEAVQSWHQALDYLEGLPEGARLRAGIYYLYFGIYSEREDLDKEQLYARLALQQAQQAGEEELLSSAWQINGTAYLDCYEKGAHKDPALLDSALYAFKNSATFLLHSSYGPTNRDPAILSALFTAQVYMDHFPPSKDTVVKYVNLALANITDTLREKRMLINCYTMLSKYALQEGKRAQAEQMLLRAQASFNAMDPPDYYVAEQLYEGLAILAEQKGDPVKALAYYKQYLSYYKKEFDTRRIETIHRLEARYQAEKKEKEIVLLKQQEAFRRKQNQLYLGIAAIAIAGLSFLFLAYHFRLRYSLQREKLLRQEKEEARLQSRLKEEEAARLRLEKHEAELQSRLQQEEAARLQAEQQLLKAQQEQMQKELLAGALQVEHKNELLQGLKEKLLAQPGSEAALRQLEKIVHEESRVDEDFEKVRSEFKDLHPEFFNRLQQQAEQKLTSLDLKYCAYIYMQLSTKQIASLLHVEPKSVRMTKYRIKQNWDWDGKKGWKSSWAGYCKKEEGSLLQQNESFSTQPPAFLKFASCDWYPSDAVP